MLQVGIIRPSRSPDSSPMLLVKKEDGDGDFVLTIASLTKKLTTADNPTVTKLLQKKAFRLNEVAAEAFERLKQAMVTVPVLALPDFALPFTIETNAYGVGLGAVLSQTKWCHYLLERKFTMISDQEAFKFLFEQREVQPQFQRWLTKLLWYDFEILYQPRLQNKAANVLSRVSHSVELTMIITPRIVEVEIMLEELWKDEELQKITEINKTEATITASLLQLLPLPELILEDWTMDFIEGLSKAGGFDSIMVIVDRLSKFAHFITLKHPFTAKQVAEVFIERVVGEHGIMKSIITDR
ncbi:retrotransposon polyprotein [Cucumis melo var. makuwa]|uniref:Retrotransposon polyprotein n=1 Tax=Cucumis melo var. makuwa TaxID=1194695 RepID=A0A5A7VDU4_CUCMM|nr:retrotransposon polyprotein [Cucumis melo var. makuwa]TYK06120.1 retrotransposon polyprotein [Cucumis melo var. makuwa]